MEKFVANHPIQVKNSGIFALNIKQIFLTCRNIRSARANPSGPPLSEQTKAGAPAVAGACGRFTSGIGRNPEGAPSAERRSARANPSGPPPSEQTKAGAPAVAGARASGIGRYPEGAPSAERRPARANPSGPPPSKQTKAGAPAVAGALHRVSADTPKGPPRPSVAPLARTLRARPPPNKPKQGRPLLRAPLLWYTRRESNPNLRLRRPPFYPLYYECKYGIFVGKHRHAVLL